MNQTEIALTLAGALVLAVGVWAFFRPRRRRADKTRVRDHGSRGLSYHEVFQSPSPNPGLTGTTVRDNTRPTASYSSSSDGGYSGYDHGHGGHDSSSDSGGCDGGGGDGGGGGGD